MRGRTKTILKATIERAPGRVPRERLKLFLLVALAILLMPAVASADTSSSTHYKVTETQFGSGAGLNSCSGSWCGRISIGDTASGSASSTSYKAVFGSVAPGTPTLEVINDTSVNALGTLSPTSTAHATAGIKVRTYLTNGYTMQIEGNPPSQGIHALSNLVSADQSLTGHEQFGINLAANTTPDIGAAPVQVPSTSTSFGYVVNGYGTANQYRYVPGDTIAESDSESGETDYTISMIFNVSNTTPSGDYTGHYSVVVVPTY